MAEVETLSLMVAGYNNNATLMEWVILLLAKHQIIKYDKTGNIFCISIKMMWME